MQNIPLTDSKRKYPLFGALNPVPGLASGSVLKLIAVITMAVDHFAASVIYYQLFMHAFPPGMDFNRLYDIYKVLRSVGRIAFPIYCFLLVEGLMHTRSRARYLRDLCILALISELPFDLAIALQTGSDSLNIPAVLAANRSSILEKQNVYFTLAIGLASIWAIDTLRKRFGVGLVTVLAAAPVSVLACLLANAMHTDYHDIGVALILVFYLLYPIRIGACAAGYFALTRLNNEEWSAPAFLLALFYNGRRGFLGRGAAAKYAFYFFYPVHFAIYVLLRVWLLHVLG